MIEEEGVEELHFTFVALNAYKLKMLNQREWRQKMKRKESSKDNTERLVAGSTKISQHEAEEET